MIKINFKALLFGGN